MSLIEQNVVLYYADFLSLKETSTHVSDNCKYYFIHKVPMNLAYIEHSEPFYDPENKYYQQAYAEYQTILNGTDEESVVDFVSNICNLAVMGCIDAELMLKQIHQFSTKPVRKQAFKEYYNWINTQKYSHLIVDDEGNFIREPCTRYIAHYERNTEKDPQVHYDTNTRS